ncbi:hypothetical protein J1614_002423 [Plenodomus biglobosus]|nr:hypothetical protein J1614_002423 [Plenodomus biglobosus]
MTKASKQKQDNDDEVYDDWLLERKVKTRQYDDDWDEGDLGDSCCFGTRTVEIGMDCVWKLHGGV